MYTLAPAVLSHETLHQQPGGEPIVYVIFDNDPEVEAEAEPVAVFLEEHVAERWLDEYRWEHGPFFVNVYEVERAYGGPEEGGWWFDTGHLIQSTPCGTDYALAEEVQGQVRSIYPRTDKRYSVIGGDDYNVVIETHPGKDFPEEWPHYE
jgi:hypothetical protein